MSMYNSCSECDSSVVATMKQEPFCETHAREKLDELKSKREVVEAELEAAEKEYERVKDKYSVESYGEIEQQVTVGSRDDIDESDVGVVSDAEDEVVTKRRELKLLTEKIESLESDL